MSAVKFAFALAVALTSTTAFAQFKATTPQVPSEFPFSLICGPLSLWPSERDEDPVHIINVAPGFKFENNKRGPLDTLTVSHVTVFGRVFLRSDQYTNDYLAQTANKLEIVWKGSLKKRPSTKMTGRLWNEGQNGRWFYSEYIEEYDRVKMKLLAGCHAPEPE